MIINLLVLINFVLGEDIEFNYPNSVVVGEVFEVNLLLIDFEDDVYDVKIDIFNSIDDGERLSRILDTNGDWVSTNYYINEIINTSESNNSVFQLNITESFEGIANITVKIRNGSTEIFEDYQINISLAEDIPEDNTPSDSDHGEIYLEAEWDEEEIINGDEFEIKVNSFYLEDEYYNLKIWIKFDDNDTIISDRYDEDSEDWGSGNYYVDEFFHGPEDKSRRIDLRIRDDYEDIYGGYFEICFKLEDLGDTEECDNIEILEKEKEEPDYQVGTVVQSQDINPITGKIIQLGKQSSEPETEDLKEQDNILYQSKTELMKKYVIYVFAFFCVALSALLVFEKLK
jgi:hypothetical protein